MKKIYLRPETDVVRLAQTQPVLVGASEIEEEVDLGTVVDDDDPTFVKRGFGSNVWDGDWDE